MRRMGYITCCVCSARAKFFYNFQVHIFIDDNFCVLGSNFFSPSLSLFLCSTLIEKYGLHYMSGTERMKEKKNYMKEFKSTSILFSFLVRINCMMWFFFISFGVVFVADKHWANSQKIKRNFHFFSSNSADFIWEYFEANPINTKHIEYYTILN